ncbi:heme peroxidase [Cladochytrium replicatum]|nr:heme peroxidase [Cladochytrium replicatum]
MLLLWVLWTLNLFAGARAGATIECDDKLTGSRCFLQPAIKSRCLFLRSQGVALSESSVKHYHLRARQSDSLYPSIDGSYNNIANPTWGMPGTMNIREVPGSYIDDGSTPTGSARPSARNVSNNIFGRTEDVESTLGANVLTVIWGQFIAHDIVLSSSNSSERMPIAVPACDDQYDQSCLGNASMPFTRLQFQIDPVNRKRNPLNFITAFIDASMIYGSDDATALQLRTLSNGKLEMTGQGLLPDISTSLKVMASEPISGSKVFFAGDVRANENPALLSLHTLFVREHNRLADTLIRNNPNWDDETIYQQARKMVIAFIQKITFDEYLPAVIGGPLPAYSGYDPTVDPRIDTFFMSSSFRYGHSAIPSLLRRLDANASDIPQGPLILRDALFNPNPVRTLGIDSILRGIGGSREHLVDDLMTDEVRKFFPEHMFDLAAANVQRGRDLGLPTYNQARIAFGLKPAKSFASITSSVSRQKVLKAVYGSVDNIDSWVGGLSEDLLSNGRVGPLFAASIRSQFQRLRDGDRWYYKNGGISIDNGGPSKSIYSDKELAEIKDLSLADIIVRNTLIAMFPEPPFEVPTCLVNAFGGAGVPDSVQSCSSFGVSTRGSSGTSNSNSSSPGAKLGAAMYLQWTPISTDSIQLTISSTGTGWFAIGFGTMMAGADMIVVLMDNGKLTALDYRSDDSRSPVLDATNNLEDIADVSGTVAGYPQSVRLKRKLNTGDSADTVIKIGSTSLIYAWSSSSQTFSYHGSNKGTATVDFSVTSTSGGQTAGEEHGDDDFLFHSVEWSLGQKILHGTVMVICFVVLYSWGIFTARYSRKIASWVTIHEHGMTIAVTDIVISALTALASGGPTLTLPHAKVGVSVFFLTIINVSIGIVIERRGANFYGVMKVLILLHAILGWTTWILGLANCFLGIELIGLLLTPGQAVITVYIKWLLAAGMGLVLMVFLLFGEVPRWFGGRSIPGPVGKYFHTRVDAADLDDPTTVKRLRNKTVNDIGRAMPSFGWKDIHERVRGGERWIVIEGIVYDVGPYIDMGLHPGGSEPLLAVIGSDCTDLFHGIDPNGKDSVRKSSVAKNSPFRLHAHSRFAQAQLVKFAVGMLDDQAIDEPIPSSSVASRFPHLDNAIKLCYSLPSYLKPNKVGIVSFLSKTLLVNSDASNPVYMFRFEIPEESGGAEAARFFPGDHIILQLKTKGSEGVISRPYTPIKVENTRIIELIIKCYPKGQLTQLLSQMVPGHYVGLIGPFPGSSSLIHPVDHTGCFKRVVLLTAGTGVAPALLMLDYYKQHGHWVNEDGSAGTSVLTLCCSYQTENDVILRDKLLEEEQNSNGSFKVVYGITRFDGRKLVAGFTGRITQEIVRSIIQLNKTQFDRVNVLTRRASAQPMPSPRTDAKGRDGFRRRASFSIRSSVVQIQQDVSRFRFPNNQPEEGNNYRHGSGLLSPPGDDSTPINGDIPEDDTLSSKGSGLGTFVPIDLEGVLFIVCGTPGFNESVTFHLEKLSVPRNAIVAL